MQKIIFIITTIFALSFISCTSNNDSEMEVEEGTFIFGSYNGFCQGNCTHLFKYENGAVFRDQMDRFEEDKLVFSSSSESELSAVAQRLLEGFPTLLTESDQDTYGCPGCADQSILFIQMGEGDGIRTWRLDSQAQAEWDQELKDYVKLLVSELEEIIVF